MSTISPPILSALRATLQWHGARQAVLAENVANADTPGFQPKDLARPATPRDETPAGVGLQQTNPMHLAGTVASPKGATTAARFETRPSGNAVNLEDEMIKIAENQSDYQLAASLYQKSLALLRTAAGGRSA